MDILLTVDTKRLPTTLTVPATTLPVEQTVTQPQELSRRPLDFAWSSVILPDGTGSSPRAHLESKDDLLLHSSYNDSDPEDRAISHVCLTQNNDVPEVPELPTQQCLTIRAETFFPSCWDGVNLDSADHKSHMAFPAIGDYNTGVCPQSHPKAILSVFYEFFYDTDQIQNFNKYVYAMGDPTGYGLHGDYIQGWTDQTRLSNAMATCQGNGLSVDSPGCSLNVGSDGTPGHSHNANPVVTPQYENVGQNGPIAALPGNNPVTYNKPNVVAKRFFA